MTCPWCGLPCDCNRFPYLRDNLVPEKCAKKIIEEMSYIAPLRKLTKIQQDEAIKNLKKPVDSSA